MTLTRKFVLLVAGLIILFSCTVFILHQRITLSHFYQIELEQRITDVERINKEINRKSKQIFQLLYEWSAWDDSYDFTLAPNEDFIIENLPENSMQRMELQSMLWLSLNFKIVWAHYNELDYPKHLDIDLLNQLLINKVRALVANQSANVPFINQGLHNFFRYQDDYFFFAIRPIIKSNNTGPKAGYLIFTQKMGKKFTKSIEQSLFLNLKLSAPSKEPYKEKFITEDSSPSTFKLKTLIQGFDENDFIELQVISTREMIINAKESVNNSILLTIIAGIAMILILNTTLHHEIIKPITQSTALINRIIKTKDYSKNVETKRTDEIGLMQHQFNQLIAQVNLQNQQLTKLASIDNLTQIANRRALEAFLTNEWKRAVREQTPIAIFLCDLDYFKQYNDNYGHQQGDECLTKFASLLESKHHRKTDLAARYGGEEFILVLPNTQLDGALIRAQKLQQELADAAIVHKFSPISDYLTVSIGIAATFPSANLSSETLIKQADQQLYLAKENGRNQIRSTVI